MNEDRRSPSEEADNYDRVVMQWDYSADNAMRIIECRNQIQWIIQNKAGIRAGQPRWRSRSYCRTRQGLEALLPGKAAEIAAALPVRFVPVAG